MMRSEPSSGAATTGQGKAIGTVPLLLGLVGGPLCWTLHLLLSGILVSAACTRGSSGFHGRSLAGVAIWQVALLLLFLVFAAAALTADVVAFSFWRAPRGRLDGTAQTRACRSACLAVAGMLLSTFFLVAIVFNVAPVFWLSGCL